MQQLTSSLKSQVKMGETMAILVIFFFLVIFGFSFYTNVQEVSYEKQKKVALDLRIIKLYQGASFMSEFQCSFKDITVENCYDSYKLRAFENIIENEPGMEEYYTVMFGKSEINVKEIYPGSSSYRIYSNPMYEEEYLFKEEVAIPISIYNATSKSFSVGLLNITVYSS